MQLDHPVGCLLDNFTPSSPPTKLLAHLEPLNNCMAKKCRCLLTTKCSSVQVSSSVKNLIELELESDWFQTPRFSPFFQPTASRMGACLLLPAWRLWLPSRHGGQPGSNQHRQRLGLRQANLAKNDKDPSPPSPPTQDTPQRPIAEKQNRFSAIVLLAKKDGS